MGMMTFLLPADLNPVAARDMECACIAGGPDNMPWPTGVQVEPGRLTVRRSVDESGYLVVPWEMQGLGRLMGSSATLMERPLPYHFQLELARGKVNQLRCQASDWQAGGLVIPAAIQETIREASLSFGRGVAEPVSDLIGKHAQKALDLSYSAAEQLTRLYMDQVFLVRHQREPKLNTALGCRVTGVPPDNALSQAFGRAFNTVTLPFRWNAIEANEGSFDWRETDALLDWAESEGYVVNGGPIIDFSSAQLPAWLWLWERDVRALERLMSNFVGNVLQRYRKRIRQWQLTAASNNANVLSLGEEELLWLTIRMAQIARQVDSEIALTIGVAQPWGEYMAVEDRTHSPFIFADALIRSELNLAAIDVEIVMGITPRGSYCRDLLETSRLLDLCALLGVPVRVTLGIPSSSEPDSKADPDLRVSLGNWHGDYSPATQSEWAAAYAGLAVCKPYVQAVQWAHFSDQAPHQFPHSGICTIRGTPKPALQELAGLRSKHLR